MAVSEDDEFLGGQTFQAHRPPGVDLVGRDADLGTQPIFETVRETRALGLKIVLWTVYDTADMRRLIEWGVDGLISDRPDVLREAAARAGIALPAPTPVRP